jgi:hypothetical protein
LVIASAVPPAYTALPDGAELPTRRQLLNDGASATAPPAYTAPPWEAAVEFAALSAKRQFAIRGAAPMMASPPPWFVPVLLKKVQSEMETDEELQNTPAPTVSTAFPMLRLISHCVIAPETEASQQMPPPLAAEFPVMVELDSLRTELVT